MGYKTYDPKPEFLRVGFNHHQQIDHIHIVFNYEILLLNILWPKQSIPIIGPCTCKASILILSQSIISLGLAKYLLVYRPYIKFIVTQMFIIIYNRQGFFLLWMQVYVVQPNIKNYEIICVIFLILLLITQSLHTITQQLSHL